jgi:Icc-related predicted phosphoesterase
VETETVRAFFVSDIHGSSTCFRKLVNAGKFYGVEYLVMGGDLAGKELVPVVEANGRWRASFRGAAFELETLEEVAEFERRVATVGTYTVRTTPDFVDELRRDQQLVEDTLHGLVLERTEEWIAFAVERLRGTGTRLLIGLGNDDFDDMVPYLDQDPVAYAHDGLLDLGDFTLASLGWSNITPWQTNRECTEDQLAVRMRELQESVDPSRTIFNIHVPPFDSGLDNAPQLGEDLQIQLVGGQPDMVPVGSTAVADSIRDYQPLLSLHGHIHEGRGVVKSGRTTVVNPGSEYDQGSLLGVVLEVKPGKVKRCQLVAG